MNTPSRTITGILLILLGLFLTGFGIIKPKEIWPLIYGIPNLIIGVFILFNKKEDEIEKIKGPKN